MLYNRLKKIFTVTLIMLMHHLISCSENSTETEGLHPLIGIWDISNVTTEYQGISDTYDENQIKEMGVIWTYIFKDDNTMELITNLSGTLITIQGTWATSGNKLNTVQTGPTGETANLIYDFTVNGDVLKLNWQIPNGTEFFTEFHKIKKE